MFLLSFLCFGVTDKGSTCEGIRHLIPPGFVNWRNGLDFYLGSLSIFIFGSFTPREVLGNDMFATNDFTNAMHYRDSFTLQTING